jgi:hypothetical protein
MDVPQVPHALAFDGRQFLPGEARSVSKKKFLPGLW